MLRNTEGDLFSEQAARRITGSPCQRSAIKSNEAFFWSVSTAHLVTTEISSKCKYSSYFLRNDTLSPTLLIAI